MLEHTAGSASVRQRIAVHQYVGGNTGSGALVLFGAYRKGPGAFMKRTVTSPASNTRMRDHILQELDVGLHATDAEFRRGQYKRFRCLSVYVLGRDFLSMESKATLSRPGRNCLRQVGCHSPPACR